MNAQNSRSQLATRRANLLAELFLQDLNPVFVSKPTSEDLGYDFLVGFSNDKAGINTFAVEVKPTERPPGSRFPISRNSFDRITHSNVPGLLLVADVKQNRLYYAWLRPDDSNTARNTVSIPIAEINETTTKQLKSRLEKAEDGVAVAGRLAGA